jgi:mono/diheme cytochrome c family protein
VAYLRTVPPKKEAKQREDNKAPFMMKLMLTKVGVTLHEPVQNVSHPDRTDKVAYGRYLAEMAHCSACHSMSKRGPRKADDRFYGGGDVPIEHPELGKVWASNLTPEPITGLGKYSADQIKEALKTGKKLNGKPMAPPMSLFIPHISGMTEEDMDALVAYLKSLKPVMQVVPERQLTAQWEKTLQEAQATADAAAPAEGAAPKADESEESKMAGDGAAAEESKETPDAENAEDGSAKAGPGDKVND